MIKPNANCIDVGVHLGSMLSRMTQLAPRGRHIGFEPVPYKAKWLRRKFPEVEVHEAALSTEPGEVRFFINTTRSGYSGLGRHIEPGDQVQEIAVKKARLDDFIPHGHEIGFIKIDVEGHELNVMNGATRILTENRPVVLFESTYSALEAAGVQPAQEFEFLTEHGYQIHTPKGLIEGKPPLTLEAFERAHQYPFAAFNFFALDAKGPRPLQYH